MARCWQFFEKRTKDGQLVPIAPGGHFYHVAIQFGGHWLHAHPFYGVQEVKDVRSLGDLYSLVEIDREGPVEKYKAEFEKTFSVVDSWNRTLKSFPYGYGSPNLQFPSHFQKTVQLNITVH